MKKIKIFLDSNIILSGTFFPGLESNLLSATDFELLTSDVCLEEVTEVVKRKFRKIGPEAERIALEEIRSSFGDMNVIHSKQCKKEMRIAKNLIRGKNDQKILAAALHAGPDFFVTGDKDFHRRDIKKLINVVSTRSALKSLNRYNP